MEQTGKSKIKKVLEAKKKQSEALLKEMELHQPESETITIENLYSQLQSLKHEIDIEAIQQKLKNYDRLFKLLHENEVVLLEMISRYKAENQVV